MVDIVRARGGCKILGEALHLALCGSLRSGTAEIA